MLSLKKTNGSMSVEEVLVGFEERLEASSNYRWGWRSVEARVMKCSNCGHEEPILIGATEVARRLIRLHMLDCVSSHFGISWHAVAILFDMRHQNKAYTRLLETEGLI